MQRIMVRPSEALWRLGSVPAEYLLDVEDDGMVDLAKWVTRDPELRIPAFRTLRASR